MGLEVRKWTQNLFKYWEEISGKPSFIHLYIKTHQINWDVNDNSNWYQFARQILMDFEKEKKIVLPLKIVFHPSYFSSLDWKHYVARKEKINREKTRLFVYYFSPLPALWCFVVSHDHTEHYSNRVPLGSLSW